MTTREQWLNQAVDLMRPWFEAAGSPLPPLVHVSIGFTGSKSRKAIGACWAKEASEDQACQIFLVPALKGEVLILATLLHELVHAALPTGTGHKRAFQVLAAKVGLEGPWKATSAGPECSNRLNNLVANILGPIPHPQLMPLETKKQTTRLRLYQCGCEKPIKVRVAADEFAATCHHCNEDFFPA